MWGNYKEIASLIDQASQCSDDYIIYDLETSLKTYKTDFINLLANQAKIASDRETLRKANVKGLQIEGINNIQFLSNDFINEAITLSDLFDMNEIVSTDLLLTAESHQSYFPGLPRGLIAVLLYYDSKVNLLICLKLLIESSRGRSWVPITTNQNLIDVATKFTKQIFENSMIEKIIGLCHMYDNLKQMTRLQLPEFCALGSPKHRFLVSNKLIELNNKLSSCIFLWSCQHALSKRETLCLISELSAAACNDEILNNVLLAKLMAFLYAIDVQILGSIDSDKWMEKLPIITDKTFIPDVLRELYNNNDWQTPGLKLVAQFAWALTLRQLSVITELDDRSDMEEELINNAIEYGFFTFVRKSILKNNAFFKEEYYVHKIHQLITNFIEFMPFKIRELKDQWEESSRIIVACEMENIEPPSSLSKHIYHFFEMMGEIYLKNDLGLCDEYWSSFDVTANQLNISRYSDPQTFNRQMLLSKFIRQSSDLLSPSLYVAHINMLSGLCNSNYSARMCFNALKSMAYTQVMGSNLLSWEHILNSLYQYHEHLKQELVVGRIESQQSRGKIISPLEIDSLIAVLKLIGIVVKKDTEIAIIMLDNSNWSMLNVLLSLASCGIPLRLKAQILDCISSFAMHSSLAPRIWQALQIDQIVKNMNRGTFVNGLKLELEDIESRAEEYPMTLAFLNLFSNLMDNPIPSEMLTGGSRHSGAFTPYFELLCETVLCKYHSRSYKKPNEKWEIASKVLEVFVKILTNYDFYEDTETEETKANRHPAYHIMHHMLADGQMLKSVLFIIDEAIQGFDKFQINADTVSIEKASLNALHLIEKCLNIQDSYISINRNSMSNSFTGRLDKALLSINPRSARSDHLLNIARFVNHNMKLIDHACCSVNILRLSNKSTAVQSKIVTILNINDDFRRELLCGFSECLEFEDGEVQDDCNYGNVLNVNNRVEIKERILRLILESISYPAPNLAHFLLNFDLNKNISQTNLQEAGIKNFPRTCLHSIILILKCGIDINIAPSWINSQPHIAELAYATLHSLCTDLSTSAPILRYLHSQDFFYQQARCIPIDIKYKAHQSWLLKCLSVEMRIAASNKQKSHTQKLTDLYLMDSQSKDKQLSCKTLLQLLNMIEFNVTSPQPLSIPHWERYDMEMKKLQKINDYGVVEVDVRRFYKILVAKNSEQVLAHREQTFEFIKSLCLFAEEFNKFKLEIHLNKHMLVAWRQLVIVLLNARDPVEEEIEQRVAICLQLSNALLHKLSTASFTPFTSSCTAIILKLTSDMLHCLQLQRDNIAEARSSSFDVTIDNVQIDVVDCSTVYASSMLNLFNGLLQLLLRAPAGQRIHTFIYGSMLNYLEMYQQQHIPAITMKHLGGSSITNMSINSINKFGRPLVDCICKDVFSEQEIDTMMSLSALESILRADGTGQWLNTIIDSGFVKQLISSLALHDASLLQMLTTDTQVLQPLFIYHSKLSLLCRICDKEAGCKCILSSDLFAILMQMNSYNYRPIEYGSTTNFIPSFLSRYRNHILIPTLQIFINIVSNATNQQVLASSRILMFVIGHMEVIGNILEMRKMPMLADDYEELRLVISVIASSTTDSSLDELIKLSNMFSESRTSVSKLQHLLLSMLTRISLSQSSLKALNKSLSDEMKALNSMKEETSINYDADIKSKKIYFCIVTDILKFIRNLIDVTSKHNNIIFDIDFTKSFNSIQDHSDIMLGLPRMHSLGVMLEMLVHCISLFPKTYDEVQLLQYSIENINNLTPADIKQILGMDKYIEKSFMCNRDIFLRNQLKLMMDNKTTNLNMLTYILENNLLIIWKHLEFYFVQSQGKNANLDSTSLTSNSLTHEFLKHRCSTFRTENLEKMKNECTSILTDNHLHQIQTIEENYLKSRPHNGILSSLVRRIKRILYLPSNYR